MAIFTSAGRLLYLLLPAVGLLLTARVCWTAPGGRGQPVDRVLVIEVPAEVGNWTEVAAAAAHPESTFEKDREIMMMSMLRGIGLSKMPDVSRMNVSREEYERMFSVYLDAVARGRRKHKEYYLPQKEPKEEVARPGCVPPGPCLPAGRRRLSFQARWDGEMMVRSRRSLGPNATRPMTAISVPIEIPKTKWRHRDATLRRATIRMLITIKPARRIPPEGLWVRLFKPPAHPGRIAKLISERMVTLAGRRTSVNRWVELDVTSAIRAWLRDPDSNRGLLAECQGCRFQGEAPEDGPDASKPLLDVVVNVRGQNHARSKRSYDLMTPRKHGRTDCRRGGEKCCRHQMEVVFHELKGFEFILQPKKFDAGFCKGRCPPRFNPAHHHALIQSLIWKQNRKLAPKPCCAPNKLKSLEILHLDEDDPTRLKVSHWEDMEVLECACS